VLDDQGRFTTAWRRALAGGSSGGGSLLNYAMIAASFPDTDLTLTGHDVSGTGTITISDHTRLYPDKAVRVTGATIPTGLTLNTDCAVFYDDPGRAGGAVTYQVVSTSGGNRAFPAYPNGGRHFVGRVQPSSGFADTPGSAAKPPQRNNSF
jgi:hypothetical protein